MDDDLGISRIGLDGDWDLAMIGEATNAYVQLYAVAGLLVGVVPTYALAPTPDAGTGRFSYPWRGGYSTVHFFRAVYSQLPRRYRPEILEIAYASPGAIEIIGACLAIGFVVKTVTTSAQKIFDVYKDVQKEITQKKLNKLSVRERAAHVQFIERAYGRLTEAMDLPDDSHQRLLEVTQNDRWARLKIVLALARRIDKVALLSSSHAFSLEKRRRSAKSRRTH